MIDRLEAEDLSAPFNVQLQLPKEKIKYENQD